MRGERHPPHAATFIRGESWNSLLRGGGSPRRKRDPERIFGRAVDETRKETGNAKRGNN